MMAYPKAVPTHNAKVDAKVKERNTNTAEASINNKMERIKALASRESLLTKESFQLRPLSWA